MRKMSVFLVNVIILNVFASENSKCGENAAEVYDHQVGNVQVKIEEEEDDKNTPNFSKDGSEVSEEVQQNEFVKNDGKLCENEIANVTVKIEEDEDARSTPNFSKDGSEVSKEVQQNEFVKNDGKLCESEIANVTVKIEEDVGAKRTKSSKYLGVYWNKHVKRWQVRRWSKAQGKNLWNGNFNRDEEEKAAHASDDLARKLMKKGEEGHKLNFPKDDTEVWAEEKEPSSKYLGVSWNKNREKWQVQRWSKGTNIFNGTFNREEEEKAAQASDDLARKLMKNGEGQHKLNFPKDDTEVWVQKNKKRKRTDHLEPQYD